MFIILSIRSSLCRVLNGFVSLMPTDLAGWLPPAVAWGCGLLSPAPHFSAQIDPQSGPGQKNFFCKKFELYIEACIPGKRFQWTHNFLHYRPKNLIFSHFFKKNGSNWPASGSGSKIFFCQKVELYIEECIPWKKVPVNANFSPPNGPKTVSSLKKGSNWPICVTGSKKIFCQKVEPSIVECIPEKKVPVNANFSPLNGPKTVFLVLNHILI